MPSNPDVRSLRAAADAVDRSADAVEADAAATARLVEGLPWHGPRRQVVVNGALGAVAVGRAQAEAERALARALRQLAAEVEHELRVLSELAARARRHLEELLRRARSVAAATADAVTRAAAGVGSIVAEVMTLDPLGAVREARQLADEAEGILRSVVQRLQTLPEPHDPAWRHLGPALLGWRPL